MGASELKTAVARTLKWNAIDRVCSQVLYAVTGIVLANILTREEYGLVGAVMVFQAFAQLFIDSGFASALLQRKSPTRLDYSTVLWFNLGMAAVLYMLLFAASPWIAEIFQGDPRIVPLGRVLFISFIINAAGIVQTNILMKSMDVRMVAVGNAAGLFAGSVVGIALAVLGFGAWAIVWQTLTLAIVRTSVLWFTSSWRPLWRFSWSVLRGFFGVSSGVMATSLLTTLFQNIYSLLIGNRSGLVPLGYFTQADKWSKMGIMSISQTLTSSFLPLLSEVQDQPERYRAICGKTHRFTAYLLIPVMILLVIDAAPIFHTLFGDKWDGAIPLFRILCVRGIFVVLGLQYSNYILSLGHSRMLVTSEIVRDGAALIMMIPTFRYLSAGVEGLYTFFLWQTVASAVAWAVLLRFVVRVTGRGFLAWLGDLVPYIAVTTVAAIPCFWIPGSGFGAFAQCVLTGGTFCGVYILINMITGSKQQKDVMGYILKKK